MDLTLGKVYISDQDGYERIVIDAEPHVMNRIRPLLDAGKSCHSRGEFTHNPISMPITMNACRDIEWIMDRYSMRTEGNVAAVIEEKARAYDRIMLAAESIGNDKVSRFSEHALPRMINLRDHQISFINAHEQMNRMLLADKMGLGKTFSALGTIAEPTARPALIVTPTHICSQWENEAKRLYPGISTHVIRGFKNYDLPDVDVVITSYNRLAPWQDKLITKSMNFKSLLLDEVHEIRHTGTGKRHVVSELSKKASRVVGMTGTPIFNYGSEIWSVMDAISPGCLGSQEDFTREWCGWGEHVREPAVLNKYLRRLGLMMRRTPEDVGLKFGEASKSVYTLDADLNALQEIQNIAKMLAMSVLENRVGEMSDSAREFDWRLRQATGVAKAKPAAEFVKMLVEQGEKVVLAGWHRDVYEIWLKELKDLNPVMFTGSESPAQKDKAVKTFIEDPNCKVFMMSLRSGSGVDGLQRVCSTVVVGELDWSPAVMDQLIARVARDGQTKHVQAYFLTVADGADPFMVSTLGIKRSQHDGLVDGRDGEAEILANAVPQDRVREMAAQYLRSIGEEVPTPEPETGLVAEIAGALRRLRVPTNTEDEMQRAVYGALPGLLPGVQIMREVKIGKRMRLDFLAVRGEEKVALELKIEQGEKAAVYKQCRRYVQDAGITGLVLLAPWHGIPCFTVDGTQVIVVDSAANRL